MKTSLLAYVFTILCAIHYSIAQQRPSPHKTDMIKSDIDLSVNALQINKIREADKYLSSAIEQVLNDDNKLECLRFFINYNADWIHKNPSAFYKLLIIKIHPLNSLLKTQVNYMHYIFLITIGLYITI